MNPEPLQLLSEVGSLTDLMTRQMGQTPLLKCVSQGAAKVEEEERQILGLRSRRFAHVRQITMGDAQNNWLFARTVIPTTTLRKSFKRLKRLNGRPLGKVLFALPNSYRDELNVDLIQASRLQLPASLRTKLLPNTNNKQTLWRRRSLFWIDTGPLLVTEVFLPDCPIYALDSLAQMDGPAQMDSPAQMDRSGDLDSTYLDPKRS